MSRRVVNISSFDISYISNSVSTYCNINICPDCISHLNLKKFIITPSDTFGISINLNHFTDMPMPGVCLQQISIQYMKQLGTIFYSLKRIT